MSEIQISLKEKEGVYYAYDGDVLVATGDLPTVTQYVEAYRTSKSAAIPKSSTWALFVKALSTKGSPWGFVVKVIAFASIFIAGATAWYVSQQTTIPVPPPSFAVDATLTPVPVDAIIVMPSPTTIIPTITAMPSSDVPVTDAQCSAAAAALGWGYSFNERDGCLLSPAAGQWVRLGSYQASAPPPVVMMDNGPVPIKQVVTTIAVDTSMQPMTGAECQAAGLARGWSATWGPASDGCWLISPDGSTALHAGTWKE